MPNFGEDQLVFSFFVLGAVGISLTFSFKSQKKQKFLMNFCFFILFLIRDDANDSIDSAFHGF